MASELENKVVNAKEFKKARKIKKDKAVDDIITKLVLFQKATDDKLQEILEICTKKGKDV